MRRHRSLTASDLARHRLRWRARRGSRSEMVRHLPCDVFAPHHVAALAGSLRLAARMQQVLRVGDHRRKIALGGAAHVGPGHVLRVAADILRPIRAIGRARRSLGDRTTARGAAWIAIAEIGLERDRARIDAGAAQRLAHLVVSAHRRGLVGSAGRRPDQQAIGALRFIVAPGSCRPCPSATRSAPRRRDRRRDRASPRPA